MYNLCDYLPQQVNTGRFIPAYCLPDLQRRLSDAEIVLPVCSLGQPAERLAKLGPWILPPLYIEALDPDLKSRLVDRILQCFPYYEGTHHRALSTAEVKVVELPTARHAAVSRPKILAFSVDTAVEEHGPHLPLATDTIQSYAVLAQLASELDSFQMGPPVEYGHLTWGLPFGMSIDITPPLLTRYVTGFTNAVLDWLAPEAIYVVDVHGSPVHRAAIEEGLRLSRCRRWSFRWLHEPLVEFAGDRGDQHAGGVETALIEHINPALLAEKCTPTAVKDLAQGQMTLEEAVDLSPELPRFIKQVESRAAGGSPYNGIVGDINNYHHVDAAQMFDRMVDIARADVKSLLDANGK